METRSPVARGSVSFGLVGSPARAGTVDVRVDRQSVLGNPFYDAWPVEMWFEDCEAYRDFVTAALAGGGEPLAACADAIAARRGVTVHRRWRQHPPVATELQAEVDRLSAVLIAGRDLRLLCHCARPFRELGGRHSPCHAEVIADVLQGAGGERSRSATCPKRFRAEARPGGGAGAWQGRGGHGGEGAGSEPSPGPGPGAPVGR
eukprot:CAMPEP_0175746274 /NCGR_PEP_ID=MMETSP0097-20121207/58505_1 /TAXON_ID=311494 /ORGANISM="Alexandrium monilatum, Strain CCMP3105" /LENGTH=203 /DNA_ID=CAMNT_0017054703 /DNA_START=38 /DNA_END=646 /DNA_ORIENTATION=-